jgi:hypothetical protein
MTRLIVPILGLTISIVLLIASAVSGSGSTRIHGKPLATILWAAVFLALFVLIVEIRYRHNTTRLRTLRAANPGTDFANVLVDPASLESLSADEVLLARSKRETRFTVGMTADALQLWQGGRIPQLLISRQWDEIGITEIETIPSSGREAPTVAVHTDAVSIFYLQPMGFLGGLIRTTNRTAFRLSDHMRKRSERVR